MEPETLRKVRGGVELTASAFEAAVGASAEMQRAIVREVYRPFEVIGPLAAPAQVIEQVQTIISDHVYRTILGVGRGIVCGAVALLERQATRG